MTQPTTAAPDYQPPRQFLDVRAFSRNLIERRSWFIGFILLDILVIYAIVTSPAVIDAWNYIWPGITVTVEITIISFILATVIGLVHRAGASLAQRPDLQHGDALRGIISRAAAARDYLDLFLRRHACVHSVRGGRPRARRHSPAHRRNRSEPDRHDDHQHPQHPGYHPHPVRLRADLRRVHVRSLPRRHREHRQRAN